MSQIRIPVYERRVAPRAAMADARAAAVAAEEPGVFSLAGAVGEALREVASIEARQKRVRDEDRYAAVKAEAMRRTKESELSVRNEADPGDQAALFGEALRDIRDWAGKELETPELRRRFDGDYGLYASRRDFSLRLAAARQVNRRTAANLDRRMAEAAGTYTLDAAGNEIILSGVLADIDRLAAADGLAPSDAAARRARAAEQAAARWLDLVREDDPQTALDAVNEALAAPDAPDAPDAARGAPRGNDPSGGPGECDETGAPRGNDPSGGPGECGETGAAASSGGGLFLGGNPLTALSREALLAGRREAEAALSRREAERAVAVASLTLSLNGRIRHAAARGDFTDVAAMEDAFVRLGRPEEAARARQARLAGENARPYLERIGELPFAEQAARLETAFAPRPDGSGESGDAEATAFVKAAAEEALRARKQAFYADPAGYAAQCAASAGEDSAPFGPFAPGATVSPGDIDPSGEADRETAALRNMALQRALAGDDPSFAPRVLAAGDAAALKASLAGNAADDAARLDALLALRRRYGTLGDDALAELDLPAGALTVLSLAVSAPSQRVFAAEALGAVLRGAWPSGGGSGGEAEGTAARFAALAGTSAEANAVLRALTAAYPRPDDAAARRQYT